MGSILFILFVFVIYFLPMLVAWKRKTSKRDGIALLNLLLGWTFLGWVIALVWAVSDSKAEPQH